MSSGGGNEVYEDIQHTLKEHYLGGRTMCGKDYHLRGCGVGQIDDYVPTNGIKSTMSCRFEWCELVLINLEG